MVISKSEIHGKGVFSDKLIKKGTILTCDVIEISNVDKLLFDYVYPFIGTRCCLHIGWASFLNSSKSSNLKHLKIDTEELISYFEVLIDIKEGEELTLNYMP